MYLSPMENATSNSCRVTPCLARCGLPANPLLPLKFLLSDFFLKVGGADGIRTHDLLDAIEARSQLRHGPTGGTPKVYQKESRPPVPECLHQRQALFAQVQLVFDPSQ